MSKAKLVIARIAKKKIEFQLKMSAEEHQQAMQANPMGRPRRPSFTERLIGHSREWFTQFYKEEEKDEAMFGQGFNDPTDDFIPGVVCAERRRRTLSLGSDASVDSFDGHTNGRQRRESLTERVAAMQLMRKPENKVEGIAATIAAVVDEK